MVALTLLPSLAARFAVGTAPVPERVVEAAGRPAGFFATALWALKGIALLPVRLVAGAWRLATDLLGFWASSIGAALKFIFSPVLTAFGPHSVVKLATVWGPIGQVGSTSPAFTIRRFSCPRSRNVR